MAVGAGLVIGPGLQRDIPNLLDPVGLGGGRVVVEEARLAGEALDPEQLFGVQAAVGLAELGMALVRHLAALQVVHAAAILGPTVPAGPAPTGCYH
jgi:hypothetical protein